MFETVRRAGGLLFIIGMVGRTPEGPVIEGGIRAQTKRSLERIDEVLVAEGRTREDIVRVRFFVTDMRLWPEAREAANAFFHDRIPPATAVGVTQLVEAGMLIEIEVEASRGVSETAAAGQAVDPTTRAGQMTRVGLLTPYFAFFDARFPADYRRSQEAYAARLGASLRAQGLDVTESGLVDGSESAAVARRRFGDAQVQVVVAAATMAAPPTYGSEALQGFDGPIVIWDDRRATRLRSDVDEVEATRASSMLGSIMLANVLGREDRRYLTVSSLDGDATDVARAAVGSAAAASLRGARLGLMGGILPGYGDVVLDALTAAALGLELVELDAAAIAGALAESRAEPATPPLRRLPAGLRPEPDVEPLLVRSLRVHQFLAAVARDASLDGLALNCHSDLLRWNDELGVVSCLASSLLWASGLPVACTGDAATSVALMLAARIAGSAQYCEGYVVESDTGEWVLSSCGMADLSLRRPGDDARLCANELYPGRHGLGVATQFAFDAGPATIVAFGPAADHQARLVAASGQLTGRGFDHLNGPSGTITFDTPGAGRASAAWIDAGPAHHLALVRGDRMLELRAAAQFLGVPLIEIGEAD